MASGQSIRRFLAYAALTAFLFSLVNRICYYHLHRLPDGQIIVHAHPYQKDNTSPYQKHKHTAREMFWLDYLAKTVFVLAFSFGITLGFCLFRDTIFFRYLYSSPVFPAIQTLSLRGPPVRC